jgi:membrane associated rhomboid family serine protease
METCYRHPNRETGVSCSNCGKPICPDCMTTTSVGMRCPDCTRQKTKVHTIATVAGPPRATVAIIAVNVLIWLGSQSAQAKIINQYGLYAGAIDSLHEYWRLISAGFLHVSIFHVGFNMYILWWLGNLLEPSLGTVRFVSLYLASLLAGSFGALLLSPNSLTVGASGAVFGLMAAAFVMQRARGIDPMASGIGPLILLNLAFSVILPSVSIGGHLGGLVGGALAALAMDRLGRRTADPALAVAVCVAVGVIAVAASIAVAGNVAS